MRTTLLLGAMLVAVSAPAMRAVASASAADSPPTLTPEEFATRLDASRAVLDARDRAAADSAASALLAAVEESFDKASPEAADLVSRFSGLLTELDRDSEAAVLLEETLATRDAAGGGDPATLSYLLYNLAGLKRTLGEFGEAEALFRRLLALTPEGSAHRSYVHNGLGMLYVEQGRLAEAQAELDATIAIARETGADSGTLAYYLNNLGFVSASLGDHDEAVRIYEETLALSREAHGDEHRTTAATLANLADAEYERGGFDRARSLHEEALAVRERVAGAESAAVGTSLRRLAELDLATGRAEDACRRLERALAIRTQHLGPDHYDTGKVMATLARALETAERTEEAESRYRESLDILEAGLGREHPVWGETGVGLATLLHRRGAAEEAWARARECERLAREHARLTASALSDRRARRYAAIRRDARDLLLSLLLDRPGEVVTKEAWDHVIRSRGLVLDEIAARRAALDAAEDPELVRLHAVFAEASERLASRMVRGPEGASPSDFRRDLLEARRAREEAERELARRSADFRRDLARSDLGLDAVRDALPAGSALVAYVRYERTRAAAAPGAERVPSYAAFVLPRGGRPALAIDLGEATAVDERVARWRSEVILPAAADLETAGRNYRAAGGELRTAVWDPVAVALRMATRVFLVPDGALHRVAFSTLPTGDDGYLLESGLLLHTLGAERELAVEPTRRESGGSLLALGGADFGAIPPAGEPPATPLPAFAPLPGTADEARAIAAGWEGSVTLLTGDVATETAFKREAPGRRVVHVATHGFFRKGDRDPRFGRGTRGIGGLGARPTAPTPDPRGIGSTLAGLAFAGANAPPDSARSDDGILTAEEIAALDFSGTEWVVLSACDTGLGDVETGEGVVGLRRAFRVSGVETIVMSLWDVDDAATRRWMEELYRNRFEEDREADESVRRSSLAVLEWCRAEHGTDHPFFWGAFVAAGRWE